MIGRNFWKLRRGKGKDITGLKKRSSTLKRRNTMNITTSGIKGSKKGGRFTKMIRRG